MPEIQRYMCPGCKERVEKAQGHCHRLGPWWVHDQCRVYCTLCGEVIRTPPFWEARVVQPYLGQPVHIDCKRKVL